MKRPLFFYIYRIVELQSDGAAVLPAAGSGTGSFCPLCGKKRAKTIRGVEKLTKFPQKGLRWKKKTL